ncbi:cell wall-binding repeat-containing protein [Streptacidiphilus jiangxiensis]|uniref:WD40-like Beta Propeller Repeat n=1 Tax=Streptacidiphilus jiangxiensis TaxID=235985 RepID=A0A1H7JEY3_STRJI|nr:cell wall-binding repeat-containing protein [Streptacidiphilus jiangxiensis]SEK73178.1 WD40-like Beta Propeller Repeat [Streptacidiphilus jiangxiensis]
MSHSSRRTLAALTSAAAVAAGLVGTFGAGAAQAATAGPADGALAFRSPDGRVHVINADGTGDHVMQALSTSSWQALSWSSDGSRLAESGDGAVTSVKPDGSSLITVKSGGNAVSLNGVYGENGSALVSEASGELFVQTSDGWNWATRVMNTKQEPAGVCDSAPALSYRGLYAFVRTACGRSVTGGVYTFDARSGAVRLVAAGADQPAFSADGSTLLYRSQVGAQTQIVATSLAGGSKQLTNDPNGASQPSLSPDGKTLAYVSVDPSSDLGQVKLLNLAAGTTTVLAPGAQPVWQPLRGNRLDHVYGTGAVSTDAAASRWQFNTIGKSVPGLVTAFNAVLVNRNDSTDAALGIALAAEKQAPLLMTSGTRLDPSVVTELHRSLRRGWTVYLEGGTNVLSNSVAAQVQRLGYRVVRVAGNGLTAQSVASARALTTRPNWVVVADAQDYRLSATAASVAASGGYKGSSVVLLNTATRLPSTLTSYFNGLNPNTTRVLVVGSRSVYAMEHTPLRQQWHFWAFGGTDPEALSTQLATFWYGAPYLATLANTSDWRSGMAGAAVNAGYGPLLWTSATGLDAVDRSYLSKESAAIGEVQIFGTGWPNTTVNAVRSAIAADPSWTSVDLDVNGVPAPLTAGLAHLVLGYTAGTKRA